MVEENLVNPLIKNLQTLRETGGGKLNDLITGRKKLLIKYLREKTEI